MKRPVSGLLGVVLAMLVGALPAWAQQAKGAPVEIGVGYFPSWNGGWSGTVIKKKELWKKYLPAGTTVRWEVTLVGFPVFNAMLANRLQVGYIGDAPSMIATTKRDVADIRIVSLHHQSPGNICAIVLVRPDAPDLKTPQEWLKWLNGKRFGVAGREDGHGEELGRAGKGGDPITAPASSQRKEESAARRRMAGEAR